MSIPARWTAEKSLNKESIDLDSLIIFKVDRHLYN